MLCGRRCWCWYPLVGLSLSLSRPLVGVRWRDEREDSNQPPAEGWSFSKLVIVVPRLVLMVLAEDKR